MLIRQVIKDVDPLSLSLNMTTSEEIPGLPAHDQQDDLHFGVSGLAEILKGPSQDIGIEGPTEPLVRRDHDQCFPPRLWPQEERMLLRIGPQG